MRGRLQTFTGLVVFVALAVLVIWAFIEAVQAEPAVVGSIGVAVVGVLGVVWQQRQTEKARLREVHRDRMSPVYDDLLGVMWGKLAGAKGDKTDPEVEEFFPRSQGTATNARSIERHGASLQRMDRNHESRRRGR
jgi:hypothetical protein